MPAHDSRLRRSLRACTLDGALHAAMLGFGETYFPAFALLLGATPSQVGVLATFPILAGASFQLISPRAGALVGNKAWVVGSAVLQALMFIPIVLLARLEDAHFGWLLLWVCGYWILALGINPAWNQWMGRMIPSHIRSRFFGRRNAPIQLVLFLSLISAGLLIHGAERSAFGTATGFAVIFMVAAASRLASAWFLTRQHEPPPRRPAARLPLGDILRGLRDQPYGRLILLLVLMSGSVNVSAAYFTPFMLRDLQLSYAQFTVLNGAVLASRVFSSAYWGEIARVYGNRRALQVSAVLLVPLSGLWVVSSNFAYLVALQLVAGFAWSGFELNTILSLFDCTEDHNRAQVLSLYNLLNGVAIVAASLLGGVVLRRVPAHGYFVIFLMSGALRALTVTFCARGAGRRRAAEHAFQNVFIRVISFRPGQGPDLRPVVLNQDAGDRPSGPQPG